MSEHVFFTNTLLFILLLLRFSPFFLHYIISKHEKAQDYLSCRFQKLYKIYFGHMEFSLHLWKTDFQLRHSDVSSAKHGEFGGLISADSGHH